MFGSEAPSPPRQPAAFKTNREIFAGRTAWMLAEPTLANFPAAWNQMPFGRFYLDSSAYTLIGGAVKRGQAILCGYAFAFLGVPFRNTLVLLAVAPPPCGGDEG